MGKKIYIAGAHSRGTTMAHYLQYLDPSIEIVAYLYNNDEENSSHIKGVPVIKINEEIRLDTECPVYLCTRGINHLSLIDTLTACGMKHIVPVDVQLDLEIRNRYLKKYYNSIGREYIKINNLDISNKEISYSDKSVCVYVASSAFDKPLQREFTMGKYEKKIQVGAALTDKDINAEFRDDTDENISNRNKQFCELTGLYWMWKHAVQDIVGLVHYRRHFLIPEDWLMRMEQYDVDVILPLPLYVAPSIEDNYRNRHIGTNWDYMLEYLKYNMSEDYEAVLTFFRETSLYSPCNMFIMRREVLNDLCQWLFPILFYVAEKGGIIEDIYQNRYPGFISERLITYFFDKNRDKYKVVYADKNFLL